MLYLVQFVTVLACGLFAGAAVYITFVEHPARMSFSTEIAARVWAPSYKQATWMQAPLATLSALGTLTIWYLGGEWWWLVGGIIIFSVVPFTLLVVERTNHQLLAPGRDLSSAETRSLLKRWGKLHAVRTVLSLIALLIFLRLSITAS